MSKKDIVIAIGMALTVIILIFSTALKVLDEMNKPTPYLCLDCKLINESNYYCNNCTNQFAGLNEGLT